ncbi:MAG: hypothetical protein IT178_16175 [Acidobacteria bacterium]|nr:hypothetical protein [Acidobacteriota bacterium]
MPIASRLACGLVLIVAIASVVTQRAAAIDTPAPRLLTQDDFEYLGYYRIEGGELGELHYGQGFTHRYVDGRLRFLTLSFFGNVPGGGYHLVEVEAPPLGETTARVATHWPDIFGASGITGNNGAWMGLWFEAAQDRLWTTWAVDYPDAEAEGFTKSLLVRHLNDDGTVDDVRGPWGLEGVQQRAIYGGVAPVPSWFQTRYGVGPYVVGWGGYASRMSIGVSLGPTAFAIPEPTTIDNGVDIPSAQFTTLADHRGGTRDDDWFLHGTPEAFDRGVRNADVVNDYDTGWQSPAPDGLGRWVWGDSAWNTGVWIDAPERHGFILVPKFNQGRVWYETSTLHAEGQTNEVQVFDPSHLGDVVEGRRAPWQVKPVTRWDLGALLAEHGFGRARTGNGPDGGIAGASWDATTGRLYLYAIGGARQDSIVFVLGLRS